MAEKKIWSQWIIYHTPLTLKPFYHIYFTTHEMNSTSSTTYTTTDEEVNFIQSVTYIFSWKITNPSRIYLPKHKKNFITISGITIHMQTNNNNNNHPNEHFLFPVWCGIHDDGNISPRSLYWQKKIGLISIFSHQHHI